MRPLEQLSNRERGLRAAQDILRGELSLRAAMNHYCVSYSAVGYYKEKLDRSGYGECLEASAAAARASEAAPVKQSKKKKLRRHILWLRAAARLICRS